MNEWMELQRQQWELQREFDRNLTLWLKFLGAMISAIIFVMSWGFRHVFKVLKDFPR